MKRWNKIFFLAVLIIGCKMSHSMEKSSLDTTPVFHVLLKKKFKELRCMELEDAHAYDRS